MVIMYDSGACGSAYSSLSTVYGGQYAPLATHQYTGMGYIGRHSSSDVTANHGHVHPWNYNSCMDTCTSAGESTDPSSVLGLPVGVMTSHKALPSCQSAYGYPSLTIGLCPPVLDLTFAPAGIPTTVPTTAILRELPPTLSRPTEKSPNHPYYWRRKTSEPPEGMTRTRDKYRVVYTAKQRVVLEHEYNNNKFLTCARRAEISKTLHLSERQIKIWFQNRRAKERRQSKRNDEDNQTPSSPETADTPSGVSVDGNEYTSAPNFCVGNCDNAYCSQYATMRQQRILQPETCVDQSKENVRPSCQFALHPGTSTEQPFNDAHINQSRDTHKSAYNVHQYGVPPAGYMPTPHHRNTGGLSASPTEWQTMDNFMPSYNISPIGASSDTMYKYRV